MADNALIESRDQYVETDPETGEKKETPQSLQRYWTTEMDAAESDVRRWHEEADPIVRRFLDDGAGKQSTAGKTRVNLFSANVQTLRSMLYGRTPKVDVRRRFTDPNDDVARVAGEILERLLNMDIERDSDTYAEALEHALDDRLIVGMGTVKLRYEVEFNEQDEVPAINDEQGQEQAPAYTPPPKKKKEDVATDYFYWKDVRWSPCRNWAENRWMGFKTPMTRDQIVDAFGEDFKDVPFTSKEKATDEFDAEKHNPWQRVEVWEIWSKERKKVYWWVRGYNRILKEEDDPLGLDGFWPCPQPIVANLTTTRFMPRADFTLAQDLYNEIDDVSSRITLLESAIAARGVYDKTSEEIKRLLTETTNNELIGVDDFQVFKEAGGLEGVVDWLPIEMFANCLSVLRDYRKELIGLLYQVSGFSDIMRGEATAGQAATATEQALKAKFASVRMKHFQDSFAKFASEAQMIKAEIISKFFDPITIFDRANVKYMTGMDPQVAVQSLQLIKSDVYQYRVEVKPENISLEDYAAIKQERSEFLTAVATFLQAAGPIGGTAPWAVPYLLQMLQWSMAGFRGSSTIEGVLDQAIMAANQMAQQQAMQPKPPDPKMEAAKVKAQAEIQKSQLDLKHTQVEHQARMEQVRADMVKNQMDHQLDMRKMEAQIRKDAITATLPQRPQAPGGQNG